MDNLHITGLKTIAQYKIMEHILKEFNYMDYYTFKTNFIVDLVDDNNIKITDKNNTSIIFTYNAETKEITHKELNNNI